MKKNIYYTIAFVLATLMSNITTTSAQLKVTEFTVDTFDPDSVLMQYDEPGTTHDLIYNLPACHLILNDSAVQIISSKFYENAPMLNNQYMYLNGTNIVISDTGIMANKKWQEKTPFYFFRFTSTDPQIKFADFEYTNAIYCNVNLTAYSSAVSFIPSYAHDNYFQKYNTPGLFVINAETGLTGVSLDSNIILEFYYNSPSSKYTQMFGYAALFFKSKEVTDTLSAIAFICTNYSTPMVIPHVEKRLFDVSDCKLLSTKTILDINGISSPWVKHYNNERNSVNVVDHGGNALVDLTWFPEEAIPKKDDETIVLSTLHIRRGYDSISTSYMDLGGISYCDEKYTAVDSVIASMPVRQLPRWFVSDTLLADICGFDVAIQNIDTLGHHVYCYATSLKPSIFHKFQQLEGKMPKGVIFSINDSTGEIENYRVFDGVAKKDWVGLSPEAAQSVFKVLSDGTILFAGTAFKEPFTLTDTLPKKVYKYYIAKLDTSLNIIWEIKSSEVVPYTSYMTGTLQTDPQYVTLPYNFASAAEVKGGILLYGSYNATQLSFLYVNKPNDSLTVGVIDMQMADNSSLKVNAERGSLDFTCYGSQTGSGNAQVRVCDLLGNEIINSSLQLIDGQTEYVRDNRLVSGVYIISVDNGKIMINKKFMIK